MSGQSPVTADKPPYFQECPPGTPCHMTYVTLTPGTCWECPLLIDSDSTMLATEGGTWKTDLFKEPKKWFKTFARHSGEPQTTFRTCLRYEVFKPRFSTFFASEHSGQVSLFQAIICVGVVHCLSPCLKLHINLSPSIETTKELRLSSGSCAILEDEVFSAASDLDSEPAIAEPLVCIY